MRLYKLNFCTTHQKTLIRGSHDYEKMNVENSWPSLPTATSIHKFFRGFLRIKQSILALKIQNQHWTISKLDGKNVSKS